MAEIHPRPVEKFYPTKTIGKKKEKEATVPLKCQAPPISKPSSKLLKIGKKVKGDRLNDFSLLATLYNPSFNLAMLEVCKVDEDDLLLPLGDT